MSKEENKGENKEYGVSQVDLFDNPMVRSALKAMTPQQRQRYKEIGEQMYGTVNFTDSKIINEMPVPMAEATAHIALGLRSGLDISDMDMNEISLMVEGYGKDWYKDFGFEIEDLPEPFKSSEKDRLG